MNKVKLCLTLLVMVLTAACAVPGTYINPGAMGLQSGTDGRWLNPNLVPINADLLQKNSKSDPHSKVFNPPPEYRVGAYDVLNIIVWEHPELSSPTSTNRSIAVDETAVSSSQKPLVPKAEDITGFNVDASGCIYFPYVGLVKVSGLTLNQVRNVLTRRLAKYIRNPQISIRVTVFRSRQVFMIGELTRQGILPLTDRPMSLFDGINRSGGIALDSADAGQIFVIRGARSADALTVYWLNAKTPSALLLSEHFYLRPDDIVYVAPAGVASWNRVVSQIMPTLQTLWYTKAVVNG